jgi:uncharacterized membrane protein YdbT with pleckstrin-like domain
VGLSDVDGGFQTRFHPVVLSGAFWFAATVAGIVTLIIVRNDLAADPTRQLVLAGGVVALLGFVGPIVRWRRSELAVTGEGLRVRTGLIRTHTTVLPHDRIASVEARPTVVGRLLDYGTIRIVGADGTYEELPRVARAIAFRDAALAASPGSRRRRAPR